MFVVITTVLSLLISLGGLLFDLLNYLNSRNKK